MYQLHILHMIDLLDTFFKFISQYQIIALTVALILLAILIYLEFKKNFQKTSNS